MEGGMKGRMEGGKWAARLRGLSCWLLVALLVHLFGLALLEGTFRDLTASGARGMLPFCGGAAALAALLLAGRAK